MKKIPVHIITGFLGSGKTTFLNRFIQERKRDRILVIENECGATNIDGALVIDDVEDIVELSAGCLCCSLSKELIEVLLGAAQRREHFDRLVIETTGIADPSSILQVFLTDPRIELSFELQQVICLTDALQVEGWLKDTQEALRQIAMSDCLLINKIDLVPAQDLKKLEMTLAEINPCAKVFLGSQGQFPIEEIMTISHSEPKSIETSIQSHEHHKQDHEHASNEHGITTFSLHFPQSMNLESLTLELNQIVHLHREQVYRIKGVIAVDNYPNRVILQSARSVFVASDGSPWQEGEDRTGTLVFIGRGLQKKALEKKFYRHMIKKTPSMIP